MFVTGSRPGQDPFVVKKHRVINRGGSTALVVGDVMTFDCAVSDAATIAKTGVGGETLGTPYEAIWHNIVDAGAETSRLNSICCVVTSLLSGAGADNTEVEVAICGRVKAKCYGTNWSATVYTGCGEFLTPDLTGSSVRRFVIAADGVNISKVAMINDDVGDVSGTAAVKYVYLFGWGNCVGGVGA